MSALFKNFLLICFCACFTAYSTHIMGQEENSENKKIIIIQETTDAFGNKTTKKTTIEGDVSEEKIENILKGEGDKSSSDLIIRHRSPHALQFGRSGRGASGNSLFFSNPDPGSLLLHGNKLTLGVYLNTEGDHMVVTSVIDGSGADEGGIEEGDVLLSIDGEEIASIEDIRNVLEDKEEGESVELRILRDEEEIKSSVELKSDNFPGMQLQSPRWNRERPRNRVAPFGRNLLQKPKLGIMIEDVDDGVLIGDVTKGSPADKAGLQEGDIITKFGGENVKDTDHLIEMVRSAENGGTVEIGFDREGDAQTASVKLAGKKVRKKL